MEYREIAPDLSLAPFVAAFWTLRGSATEQAFDLVLPDGHAELVVHRTGRFRQWQAAGDATEQPSALVVGVMERAIALAPARRFETLGVRFTPTGLACLCDVPASALSDRLTPAEAVAGPGLARVIATVASAESMGQALNLLRSDLGRLFSRMPTPPRTLVAALRLIDRTSGTISMDRLASHTGATARWLERQFNATVGLPPKRYARVVRFHRACQAIVSAPGMPGADLALRHGYYDQAHFGNEFKSFTGWAPREFVSQQLGELTRHFAGGTEPL
jgi:AraC-like DNA-binding protein